ncbi:MAG: hypothetical protein SGARI_006178, partial [Bacillariaceae sp.]
MAFCDSLLHGLAANENKNKSSTTKVVLIDQHVHPGGQWNDSYSFVQLHQPSNMYGVETVKLEPGASSNNEEDHRATRQEILDYYQQVVAHLSNTFHFTFVGGVTFDMQQLLKENATAKEDKVYHVVSVESATSTTSIHVKKKVVDARYLQPDLPVHIPPKFTFDANKIKCVPVNELVNYNLNNNNKKYKRFVVIGGGKTGMDAIVYLLRSMNIDPSDITW